MIDFAVSQALAIIAVVLSFLAWLVQWRNDRRRISDLQGDIASHEKKANELAAEVIGLKSQLTEAQIALARLEASAGRVPQLESQIAGFRETETSLTWHQSTLQTTEARLAEVEASLEEERVRIEELVTRNVRLESERIAEEEAYREKVEALTSIRTDIEEKMLGMR